MTQLIIVLLLLWLLLVLTDSYCGRYCDPVGRTVLVIDWLTHCYYYYWTLLVGQWPSPVDNASPVGAMTQTARTVAQWQWLKASGPYWRTDWQTIGIDEGQAMTQPSQWLTIVDPGKPSQARPRPNYWRLLLVLMTAKTVDPVFIVIGRWCDPIGRYWVGIGGLLKAIWTDWLLTQLVLLMTGIIVWLLLVTQAQLLLLAVDYWLRTLTILLNPSWQTVIGQLVSWPIVEKLLVVDNCGGQPWLWRTQLLLLLLWQLVIIGPVSQWTAQWRYCDPDGQLMVTDQLIVYWLLASWTQLIGHCVTDGRLLVVIDVIGIDW